MAIPVIITSIKSLEYWSVLLYDLVTATQFGFRKK
jgi:hypothetical protein